MDKLERYIVLL